MHSGVGSLLSQLLVALVVGPVHLLVNSAGVTGFDWDPSVPGWVRPGHSVLGYLAGPFHHFKETTCRRQKFSGVLILM